MEKKRILLVSCEGLGRGGVQAVMMSIVRTLSEKYIFDIILFTGKKRDYDEEFLSYGGNIYRIPNYDKKNKFRRRIDFYLREKRIYKGALRCIEQNGPYIAIHCNNGFEGAPCLKAAYKKGIPVRILHTHVITHKTRWIRKIMNRHYLWEIKKYATQLVGCSEWANETMFGCKTRALVINNPYNDKKFCSGKYSMIKNNFEIIQVGNYSALKNQIFSLHVFRDILDIYPNAVLHLVGFDVDGYELKIREEIRGLEMINSVKLHSSDADIPYLLSESSIFIFPSLYEGFGIVAIEAQSMGVHVFASDTIPKNIDTGGCTFLSLSLGSNEWAKQIVSWYEANRDIPQYYDCSAFTEKVIMHKYEALYEGKVDDNRNYHISSGE